MSSPTLGLIAGNGQFPILFARRAKTQNYRVIAAAIRGDTFWGLKFFVDDLVWISPGELRRMFEFFKTRDVRQIIMAGQVHPKNLFDEKIHLDQEFQKLFAAMQDRKADTIFGAVAEKLAAEGMELIDSTFLLKDYLAPKGTLTHRVPTLNELADIEFGFQIAKSMGGLDVGQTVVVKDKAIVAVEAMEGTDETIARGGRIAKQGAVVIKTAKPQQDYRFDIPVIGTKTITTMRKANASCLAIEAGKTLILDRETSVRLANKAGICIVAA